MKLALFGSDSCLPMVFQYNPVMHHIEVNENDEVVFIISRRSLLSPRIRFGNVHDLGGVLTSDDGRTARRGRCGYRAASRRDSGDGNVRLPFCGSSAAATRRSA